MRDMLLVSLKLELYFFRFLTAFGMTTGSWVRSSTHRRLRRLCVELPVCKKILHHPMFVAK